MAGSGLRLGILGATGALGAEVLAALGDSDLAVAEIVPIAKDDSLGRDVELHGEVYPVEVGMARVRGLDLLILCAPPAVSLEGVREALRASVPCLDASGVLAASPEVALRVAAFGAEWTSETPLVVAPPGPALALALVLRPLAEAAGLARVSATLLEGASVAGRSGIEALYQESLALFNQQDLQRRASSPAGGFRLHPGARRARRGGRSDHENALSAACSGCWARASRSGSRRCRCRPSRPGAAVALETERGLDPKEAARVLALAPGVEPWTENPRDATMRAAAGRPAALVARLRRDPVAENGLALWISADPLRLCAANAVALARARFGPR